MAMAELVQKKTSSTTSTNTPSLSPSKPKTTCFLGCFGFSSKVPTTSRSKSSFPATDYIRSHDHDHLHLHVHQHHQINKPNDIEMKTSTSSRRWYLISWSSWRFCADKSVTKTVPIDASGTGTGKRRVKLSLEKTKSKSKSKFESGKFVSNAERTVSVTDAERPGGSSQREDVLLLSPVSDPQQTQKPPARTTSNSIILEHRRRQLDSSKEDTCQRRLSFCWKIYSIRSGGGRGGSQPGSPVKQGEKKPKSSGRRTASSAVMSHSESIPSQKRQSVRAANSALPHNKQTSSSASSESTAKAKADDDRQHQHQAAVLIASNFNKKKNLDPLVGMSIIVVTLIIMLFWGRLCAILCTSAWFFFLPRSSSSAATTATASIISDLDLNSEEYKKKVVLDGFLDRNNHRNNNNNI